MTSSVVYSFAICALGAALEGLFAGSGVKQRLQKLRLPSYAVPFWGWMAIGGFYYLICFIVLYRLFLLPPASERNAAFALVGTLMFINALWNYFFFRSRNLFRAYALGFPYSAIALVLLVLLFLEVDRVAAVCFLPYVFYLFYGIFWGRAVWKLNP